MENEPQKIIKALIIEDQRELREGLQTLVNFTDGFKCIGAFRTAEEGIARARNEMPDVVLTDIGLPGIDGIEGTRQFKEMNPNLTILVLSVYEDDERIFDALCAGACGYLLKRTPPTKLLENIREAVTGGAPMSPEVARRVITLFRDFRPPERVDYDLTPHETRILKLLVDGYNFTTAAKKLGVSYNTVKFHMTNIYDKLQVHSKTDAVAKALKNRLLD
jgi:DNA-binding NarL/FixJ family response regulator